MRLRAHFTETLPAISLAALLALGLAARVAVFAWQDPYGPHHPDEAILTLEGLALWEGVTPREVGWPASTTRLLVSAAEGVQWLVGAGDLRTFARDPFRALESLASWAAARYADPAPLYGLGRGLMVAIGMLQLAATAWSAKQWTGWTGTLAATLAVAIAPMPVAYSQYILADMTGVLFGTVIVGLAARPTRAGLVVMGALSGLAAASKFHFGIWLLTPLCCIWLSRDMPWRDKWGLAFGSIATAAAVVVMLVPWFWLNPVLAAKEFAGVVLVKVAASGQTPSFGINAWTILAGLGAAVLMGAVLGLCAVAARREHRAIVFLLPTTLAILVLSASAIVFDRYGLVALPGLALLGAIGWDTWLGHRQRQLRAMAGMLLVISGGFTVAALIASQREASLIDVDVLTRDWVVRHVTPGARVARHAEDTTYLPRTEAQLTACVNAVSSHRAYVEKLGLVGFEAANSSPEPMRAAILNDEMFQSHWCRRELGLGRRDGYHLVPYHAQPRFGAVLEREAVADFRSGWAAASGGVDVLVMNRPVDVGVQPAIVFESSRGQRVIYVRPVRTP